MIDEIEFLVSETLKHHQDNYASKEPETSQDGPGIMALVQKSTSSLRAYCLSSENLLEDAELYGQLPSTFSEFKGAALSELMFFPCSQKEASYIEQRLHGKRFFLQDDLASNLIRPSDYWWLVISGDNVEVSFEYQKSDAAIRLGPLGDKKLAKEYFNCAYDLFHRSLEIKDFCVSDSGFSFSIKDDNPYALDLLHLLKTGEVAPDFEELTKLPSHRPLVKRFLDFIQQVAALRSFWIKID